MTGAAIGQEAEANKSSTKFTEARRIRPETWTQVDDYPSGDFRSGVQGTVGTQMSFDLEGKPYRCEVYASSGSKTLDAANCVPIFKRARVVPARDETGTPVYSAISGPKYWVNPNAWAKKPQNEEGGQRIFTIASKNENLRGRAVVALLVEADGRVAHCRSGESSDNRNLADIACEMISKDNIQPLLNERNEAVRSIMTWTVTFTGQKNPATPRAGDTFVRR